MFRKIFVGLLVMLFAFTLVACNDTTGGVGLESEGDTLVIRVWNDEFIGRFRDYYPGYVKTNQDGTDVLDDGTVVKWIKVANDNNAYQIALDTALANQSSAAANDKIDMFLIEADYATKYANDLYAMDVVNELKIKESALADQYQYTKDIVTDKDGVLRAVSWQATPGLFAYRADLAREVLGTDDPVQVQSMINTWAKFDAVAAQMKAKTYKMLSGYDDAFRAFSNSISQKWVDANNNVVFDQQILNWIKQTKAYSTAGYNNGNGLWSDGWQSDQGINGDVFGFFYSTWGINFTLLGNSLSDPDAPKAPGNGLFGEYRVVQGPASYYWGGTWLVGAKGTDNPSLVRDIMLKLTANPHIAEQITRDTEDYTNNKTAMTKIANDETYGSAFLGGQNHIALFTSAAQNIDMSNASPYDQGLNEGIQTAMKDYFAGTSTFAEAYTRFKEIISEKYPELVLPATLQEPA